MWNMTSTHRSWWLDYRSARLLSLGVVLGGLWQIAAPYLFGFANDQVAMRNAIGSGILLAVFSALSAYGLGRWSTTTTSAFGWLASLTGLWLAISPFILNYEAIGPAFWSALIVGLVSFIIAGMVASFAHDHTSGTATS